VSCKLCHNVAVGWLALHRIQKASGRRPATVVDIVLDFPHSTQVPRQYLKQGHDRFLPSPFQLIYGLKLQSLLLPRHE
jgi:hypothetical protein